MIVWCDVETTGLDPKVDQILEVAVVVTDDELKYDIETDSFSIVIRPHFLDVSRMAKNVGEMHSKNGLFAEIFSERARSLSEAEGDVKAFLGRHGIPWTSPANKRPLLAGSSVHFDRKFLEASMPTLANFFHYRNLDVSTLRSLVRMWHPGWGQYPKNDMHRALQDTVDSIEEMKYYRQRIFGLPSQVGLPSLPRLDDPFEFWKA